MRVRVRMRVIGGWEGSVHVLYVDLCSGVVVIINNVYATGSVIIVVGCFSGGW